MGKQGCGRWVLFVTWALSLQHVLGGGTLDIWLRGYNGDGQDHDGGPCDYGIFSSNPCDVYFIICVDRSDGSNRMDQCSINKTTTGVFHEQNSIWFGADLKGIANPLLFHEAVVPNHFNIKVGVHDQDPLNGDDHIDDLMGRIFNVIPSPNGVRGGYTGLKTLTNTLKAIVTLQVRSTCDRDYYGSSCTKFCQPNVGGHYTCNKKNGDKICSIGWKGAYCNEDINECELGFCKNSANCTNNNGGFECKCRPGFKGVFCDNTEHACVINPCKNGGSCHVNETTKFICSCPSTWEGETCEEIVNPCDAGPCYNNATCVFNVNVPEDGLNCECTSDWTGDVCDVKLETSTKTTITSTTTLRPLIYGDPYYITLLGVIDPTNIHLLESGLSRLIHDLGGVPGEIYVKVNPKTVPIKKGVITTYVEFFSASTHGPVDVGLIDDIFKHESDETINSYLPLPLYRPIFEPSKQEQVQQNWVSSNWYAIVLPILIALVLVACLIAFIIVYRRKKEKSQEILPRDSNIQEAQTQNMAFENVLYHETHRQQRESDVLDGGEARVTPNGNAHFDQRHQASACADEVNPYTLPVQYDTPVKQAECGCNSAGQYQNSNLATLDTRCQAGDNDYTDFNDLEGAKAKEENHYQELDDVLAQKVALSVGLPPDGGSDTNISIDDTDDEDDIDKIKASFKDHGTDA